MEHVTYELAVPGGYREVYHIDATHKKTAIRMTIGATVILVVAAALVLLFADFSRLDLSRIMIYDITWIVMMIVYIVLHELTHGAVYKALTHQKLSFGISWSAAFCGVPDVYTYRRTALLSLAAPLTVFTVVLIPLMIYFHSADMGWYLVCGLTFALHISGCIGDMYMIKLFLSRFKDPRTLMRDTGPAQWVYVPEEAAPEEE